MFFPRTRSINVPERDGVVCRLRGVAKQVQRRVGQRVVVRILERRDRAFIADINDDVVLESLVIHPGCDVLDRVPIVVIGRVVSRDLCELCGLEGQIDDHAFGLGELQHLLESCLLSRLHVPVLVHQAARIAIRSTPSGPHPHDAEVPIHERAELVGNHSVPIQSQRAIVAHADPEAIFQGHRCRERGCPFPRM